jgi:aspartyl protease family protein
MRSVVFFAIMALAIAGLMPKVMSSVGSAHAPEAEQQAKRLAPAPQTTANYRTVEVRGDQRGQYQVEGTIEGRRMDFIVDTGATVVALRERDAARLGIHPGAREFTASVSTANGVVRAARVRLPSVEVRGIRVFDVQALVLPDTALSENLLGMSFLSRVRRFEIANGRLVMEQ